MMVVAVSPARCSACLVPTLAELSPGIGCFSAVHPTYPRCGRTGEPITICVHYGGLDVSVRDFVPHRGALITSRIRWLQQRE